MHGLAWPAVARVAHRLQRKFSDEYYYSTSYFVHSGARARLELDP
jgi:hypothetical protein